MSKCKKCKRDLADDWIWCPWCGKKQTSAPRKAIKRENGTGSVYKRADLKNRPYVAVTPAKKGKRPETIGYYATAQEAKDAVEGYRKNPTDRLNITLKEIYEEWKPIGLKDKSKQLGDSYNAAFNKLSPLHDMKFREIGYGHVQNIIEALQKERPKLDKAGKPIIKDEHPVMLPPASYSALHDIKVLAGLLCKYGMKNNIIHENWAELLDLPKDTSEVKDCFNEIEQKKIENAAFGTNGSDKVPFADCILFMCYTGLRITEFLKLSRFSVHRQGNACALYGGIKTDAGKNKIVPVHHKVQPVLEEWLTKGGQTIFCWPDGHPYSAKYFREKCFYPALEKIGVRRLTPHACRRTCATMMSKAGVKEEDFIAIMGHTDFKVDIDSYIFQTAEKLRPAIEKMS
jgi:integrase